MSAVWFKILSRIDNCMKVIQARQATLDTEVCYIQELLKDLAELRNNWQAVWNEVTTVASNLGINNSNNNDILLRTHGPYHRHKSTNSVLLDISAHCRNGVSTWPTLGGAKQFILSTAASSFAKAQKMDNHTVEHYTTGVSTCPALRRARPIPALLTFLCLVCTQCPHVLLHKSNTGETQTPKHFTDDYCICSPYRSVE